MAKITFTIAPHSNYPGEVLVQILLDNKVVGTIYADHEREGIKIVSVHMAEKNIQPEFSGEVTDSDGSKTFPHIPAVEISFKPSPWRLSATGHVIKVNK